LQINITRRAFLSAKLSSLTVSPDITSGRLKSGAFIPRGSILDISLIRVIIITKGL
jgi:hypothetical protein